VFFSNIDILKLARITSFCFYSDSKSVTVEYSLTLFAKEKVKYWSIRYNYVVMLMHTNIVLMVMLNSGMNQRKLHPNNLIVHVISKLSIFSII